MLTLLRISSETYYMTKAAYPTIGIAAFVMFGIVYFIGCLRNCEL